MIRIVGNGPFDPLLLETEGRVYAFNHSLHHASFPVVHVLFLRESLDDLGTYLSRRSVLALRPAPLRVVLFYRTDDARRLVETDFCGTSTAVEAIPLCKTVLGVSFEHLVHGPSTGLLGIAYALERRSAGERVEVHAMNSNFPNDYHDGPLQKKTLRRLSDRGELHLFQTPTPDYRPF